MAELDWDLNLEYDPLHPSDYDKIIRGLKLFNRALKLDTFDVTIFLSFITDRRERRGMELEIEEGEKKRRTREDRDSKPKERYFSIFNIAFL